MPGEIQPDRPTTRLPWAITVLSDNVTRARAIEDGTNELTWFSEVKTALLYGDRVEWLATAETKRFASLSHSIGSSSIMRLQFRRRTEGFERYESFVADAMQWGLPIRMITGPQDLHLRFRNETGSQFHDFETFENYVTQLVTQAQILLTDREDDAVAARWWDSPSAAQVLMQELAHLLLPEVGSLPIEAIADLRSRLEQHLDGLRAEMLRLSETLRLVVRSEYNLRNLRHEARNVIATNVEPVIRETAIIVNELMQKRWKKFFTGGAKVIGFTAAGFLQAAFWKEALKEAAQTVTAVVDAERQPTTMKNSAQFVIEARSFLAKRL